MSYVKKRKDLDTLSILACFVSIHNYDTRQNIRPDKQRLFKSTTMSKHPLPVTVVVEEGKKEICKINYDNSELRIH
ncbi:MAG: hypothetical protein LC117_11450 [Bacteroidia bacterium]|nr:hypothetical protein [Bacteroidia bacterium]MCZ2278527.1 hypothetical protein [Bacteroidia bacterium]